MDSLKEGLFERLMALNSSSPHECPFLQKETKNNEQVKYCFEDHLSAVKKEVRRSSRNNLVSGPWPSIGVEATLAAEAAATAAINIRVTQPTPNHSPSGSMGSLGASGTTAGAAASASAVSERVPAPEAIADALESLVPQQQSSSSNSDTLPSPALSNKSGISSGRFVSNSNRILCSIKSNYSF